MDNTTHIQTVSQSADPWLWLLLHEIRGRVGEAVLLNGPLRQTTKWSSSPVMMNNARAIVEKLRTDPLLDFVVMVCSCASCCVLPLSSCSGGSYLTSMPPPPD